MLIFIQVEIYDILVHTYMCVCIHWNESGAGARERRDSGRQDGRQRRHGADTAGPGDARGRGPHTARGLGFVRRAPGSTAGVGAGVLLHGE